MPFLDELATVLGGWGDVKQIDRSGFDFREKRAQDEFLRQRQREEARQADEDRGLKMAEDVFAGAEEGQAPDISPLLQSVRPEQRGLMDLVARGRGKERKSALESTRAYNQNLLQGSRDAAAMQRVEAQGEIRKGLMEEAERIRTNQQMSPRDKDAAMLRYQQALDLFDRAEAGRESRFGRTLTGRPQLRQTRDAQGNAVWEWISPGQGGVQVAPTAIERQVSGMAGTVKENVGEMERLAPDVTSGRLLGNLSKASQWALGPHGKEGEFDFDANAVIDAVYVKSGKQINETEMRILRNMIPNRGRGNLPEQVRLFKDYAESLLQKYGGAAGPGTGGEGVVTYGGKWYRLRPGANPKLRSSYEEVP
jgi:hypothetical protein